MHPPIEQLILNNPVLLTGICGAAGAVIAGAASIWIRSSKEYLRAGEEEVFVQEAMEHRIPSTTLSAIDLEYFSDTGHKPLRRVLLNALADSFLVGSAVAAAVAVGSKFF